MASFCFISIQHPSHCDLGGHGFLRTAQKLLNHGHTVTWIFSHNPSGSGAGEALKSVESCGIKVVHLGVLELYPAIGSMQKMIDSAKVLEAHFRASDYGCVVVERSCTAATFSAHLARIPWAIVGSDGREWRRAGTRDEPSVGRSASFQDTLIRNAFKQLVNDGYEKPNVKSCFATSPFLNISFFPKVYYPLTGDLFPAHSHFLGGKTAAEKVNIGDRLLVTFGNTMAPQYKKDLVKTLFPALISGARPVLFLTGNSHHTWQLTKLFRGVKHVEIRDRVPYAEAFNGARTVIGHGGNAHVWHGIHEAATLIAVPWLSDQLFGANQIERLGIGYKVQQLNPAASPADIRYIHGKGNSDQFLDGLDAALSHPMLRSNAEQLSQAMRSGGGVNAAVDLLERLECERSPIVRCLSPACCC